MKRLILILVTLALSGCSATLVSYNGKTAGTECPPVVSVRSLGNSVIITDGLECKREGKK
jgi:uncharacterized protein YceK